MYKQYRGPPATIASLQANGVKGVEIRCASLGCYQRKVVSFDALSLPDTTPFPSIATAKPWVCSVCGGRAVRLMPDWPDPRAGPRLW